MTVKILTASQKEAVKLLYSHKRKNQKELAMALGVSERTIHRTLEEEGAKNPGLIDTPAEAKKVMALLYKHKVTFEQLESMLRLPTGQTSLASSVPAAPIVPVVPALKRPPTMLEVQEFLCLSTREDLATLFFAAGLAKIMDMVQLHKASQDQAKQANPTPTAPIPKSAQQPLDLGVQNGIRT